MRRQGRLKLAGLVVLTPLLLHGAAASACEPCERKYSLLQTAEKSALIVAVDAPELPADGKQAPFYEYAVHSVLKGKWAAPTIRVRAWYGMCAYGLTKPKGRMVVLLAEPDGPEGSWSLAREGCGDAALEGRGVKVRVRDRWLSLDAFSKRYGR